MYHLEVSELNHACIEGQAIYPSASAISSILLGYRKLEAESFHGDLRLYSGL